MTIIVHSVRLSCLSGLLLLLATVSVHHPATEQHMPALSVKSTVDPAVEQTAAVDHPVPARQTPARRIQLSLGDAAGGSCEQTCTAAESSVTPSNHGALSDSTEAQLAEQVSTWTYEDYRQFDGSDARLTGAEAYMAYLYLSMCQDSIRDHQSFSTESERLESLLQSTSDLATQTWIDERLVDLETEFIRCQGLEQTVLVARIEWLMRSAERGYAPAQAQYYQTIPELIGQDHLISFRFPHLIDRFRQLAPEFLAATLSEDSPESYLLYSRAILDGVVLDPNAVDAYAYAYAALLLDQHRSSELELELEAIASILAPNELKLARRQGQALVSEASATS